MTPNPESPSLQHSILAAMGAKDELFAGDHYPVPFSFNEEVAAVFDDMVTRSVPLYKQVTILAGLWGQRFYKPQTRIYDLGCSTGTVMELLCRLLPPAAHMVGVDASLPMVARCQEKLASYRDSHTIEIVHGNLEDQVMAPSSVVYANYTLQFLAPESRSAVIKSVYESLVPGGLFFLSEKVVSPSAEFQATTTELYEGFKEAQGYSKLEIARKKQALENVLVPFSESDYVSELIAAGFTATDSICKWNNFVTLVARK